MEAQCCHMAPVIIESANDLLPVWSKAICWSGDDLLSMESLGTNFIEIMIEI